MHEEAWLTLDWAAGFWITDANLWPQRDTAVFTGHGLTTHYRLEDTAFSIEWLLDYRYVSKTGRKGQN